MLNPGLSVGLRCACRAIAGPEPAGDRLLARHCGVVDITELDRSCGSRSTAARVSSLITRPIALPLACPILRIAQWCKVKCRVASTSSAVTPVRQ